MKLIVLLLAAWLLLVTPSIAHADPISALVTAISAAVGGLGAIGQFVVGIALKIGVGLLQKAMQKEPDPVGVSGQIDVGGDNPISFIVGTFATPGQLEYGGTWGKAGKTPNAYFTRVFSLGDLPVNGLVGLIVNGEKCTIDYDETKYGNWGYPVEEFSADGDNALWIKFYDGTQTEPDPLLMEQFGDHPDRPWSEDMIGRGMPYAIVTAQYKRDVMTGPPNCIFVLEGIKLYDPRKDSSVGGSGPHRWGQPATYEWSENPKVIQYNVMRGIYYDGEWVYGGQGMRAFQLPTSSWFAAMNECDRLVSIKGGGTEKNFRCGYEVKGDLEPIELCQKLDRACNGKTAENGGIYKTVCGNPGLPVYYFTDEDLIISEPQTFTPFPGLEKTYNGAHASYPEPDEAWSAKDAPPRYRSDLEAEDDGRRLIANLTYEAVPYKRQVQRLMRAAIEANRRFRSHQGVFTPAVKLLEPLDVIAWTSARNGYDNKRFQLGAVDDLNNVNQSAAFSELDPADYDWSTDYELPDSVGPIGRVKPQPQVLTGFGAFPATVKNAMGVDVRPAILLTWPYDSDDVAIRAIAFQVRKAGETSILYRDRSDQPEDGQALLASYSLLPVEDYEVRAKFVGGGNTELFAWSAWLPVTTPDVVLIEVDVLDGSITAAKLADAAVEANKIMTGAVTELKLADRAVSDLKIKLAAVKTELIDNQAVVAAALADVAVVTSKLADNAVQVAKVADNAILMSKLADNAVTVSKIASGAVIASKIADAAITTAKFAAGLTPVEIVTSLPTTGNFEGRQAFYNGKTYRYTSGAWDASSPLVPGQVTSVELQDGAAIAAKIAAGAVGNAQLAALAVDAAKLATNAVTTTKIADNAITTPKLVTGAVVADKVAAGAITAGKLLVSDPTNLIMNGSFTSGQMDGWNTYSGSTLTVSAGSARPPAAADWIGVMPANAAAQNAEYFLDVPCKPGDEFFVSADVASDGSSPYSQAQCGVYWYDADNVYISHSGLPTQQLYTAWVTMSGTLVAPANAAKMQRFRMTRVAGNNGNLFFTNVQLRKRNNAELIVDGAIIASKVAALAISTDKLAANAVSADKIQANAVTADKVNANAVTADKIATNAITADKIAANAIVAGKIAAGAVSATEIAAGAVTASKLLVSDMTNLVMNGSFAEGQRDGWNSSVLTVSAGTARPPAVADWLGILPADAAVQTADYSLQTPCKPGDEFFVSADIASSGSSPYSQGQLGIVWYDGANAYLSTSYLTAQQLFTAWVTTSGTLVAPANAAKMHRLVVRRLGGNNGSLFFTNVQLRKKNTGELIVDGAIIASKVAANAITTEKINAGAVTATEIATNAVTAIKIEANAVTAVKINAGAVTADKIEAEAVTAVKIKASSIAASHLATNSVTADAIKAGAVTAIAIEAGSVTTDKIYAEAITGAKIAANSVGAYHIAANSITAKQLVIMDWENIAPNGQWLTGDNAGWGSYPSGWNVVGAGARPPQRGDYILSTPGVADDRTMSTAGLDVPLQGGEQFNVQFDCAGSGSGASWGFRVRCVWYGAGSYISGSTVSLDGTSVGWQRAIGTMNVPAAADRLNRIEITRVGGGANNAYITNVIIRRKKGGELIVDGAITGDHLQVNSISVGKIEDGAVTTNKLGPGAVTGVKIANGAVNADKIIARVITADKLVLGDITYEEIGNNQITVAATAWTNSTTGIDPDNSWSGIGSVSVTHGDTDCKIVIQAFAAASLNQTYATTYSMRITDTTSGTTVLRELTSLSLSGSNSLIMMSYVFNPPSGRNTSTFNVQVKVEGSSGAYGQFRNRFVLATVYKR